MMDRYRTCGTRLRAHRVRPAISGTVALVGFATLCGIGMPACTEKSAANGGSSMTASLAAEDSVLEWTRRRAPVAVILFQTPTECLTCSADTYSWIELTREADGALLVVLTEPPTSDEAAALKRMRLNFTVMHEPFHRTPGLVPPAIAVFRGPDTLLLEGRLTALRRSKLLDSTRRLLQHK